MADNTEANDRYAESIALLTVLIQIRENRQGRPTDSDLAEAQTLVTRVQRNT